MGLFSSYVASVGKTTHLKRVRVMILVRSWV